jgi:hypothetical protein
MPPKAAPALSAHANRNQTRAVNPTRKRGPSTASKNTNCLANVVRAQLRAELEEEVEEHYLELQGKVTAMYIKYKRTEMYIKQFLTNGTRYKQTRAALGMPLCTACQPKQRMVCVSSLNHALYH